VRYLLDTTFVIDHLRGESTTGARLARLFADGDVLMVNEVVVCEAATGARLHPDPDLAALLEPMEFIQPGAEAAVTAGRWRAEARARGQALSLADSLIAAAADVAGATVLTRNVRDFRLTPVPVEDY
jgi:predicted nucleic acid-binding protein